MITASREGESALARRHAPPAGTRYSVQTSLAVHERGWGRDGAGFFGDADTHEVTLTSPDSDVAVTRPSLREGHLVPEHGVTRGDALADGLAEPWHVAAALDDHDRVTLDVFTVHLLTTGTHWSVVLIHNQDWHYTKDRHTLLTEALDTSAVDDSLSGLTQRYCAPSMGAEFPRSLRAHADRVSTDVLGLLLGLDYPQREEDAFLLALGGQMAAVQHRHSRIAFDRARRHVYKQTAMMFKELETRGIYREQYKCSNFQQTLERCLREHWDGDALTTKPGYEAAHQALLTGFFGNVLDD